MEVSSSVLAGKRVLVVWYGGNRAESIQEVVEDLRGKTGASGEVLLEHADRLLLGQKLILIMSSTFIMVIVLSSWPWGFIF